MVLLCRTGGSSKNKLDHAHWVGGTEIAAARKKAKEQINRRERNKLTLFVVKPKLVFPAELISSPGVATPNHEKPIEGEKPKVIQVSKTDRTIWLPDANRGIAVLGGTGSGKTYGVIDPAIRSAIDQGFPIILYDYKYAEQSSRIAGIAADAGYKVSIFAPSFPESGICNPLDFIRDATDVDMARQVAIVLNRNFKSGGKGNEDPFFTNSGDQLIQAVLLLAKTTPYPDIIFCAKALGANNLPARVQNANLPTWVETSFGQLISMADSEKTVASVISTASILFSRFMSPDILSVFCGKTTIPMNLKGKHLLVIGMKREKQDVVAPLLATVLHMIVTRNVTSKREDPLLVAIDELPTLYLPSLVQWLNVHREDGLSCMLGFQNLVQLEETYGKEVSRAIFGGCATKAIFNPLEPESAKIFSDYLGDEHLKYKSKSRSSGGGKTSTSTSDQERTRKLFAPEDFLKLPQGNCILISPGYSSKKEANVPRRCNIKIPKVDADRAENSKSRWEALKVELEQEGHQIPITDAAILARKDYFLDNFPLPAKDTPATPKSVPAWAEGL
ncbi:type IV secretory system conjugative DNA transfer family protein [Pseudanabaena sp. SR411]|uniref:type IV secretory system conjugative DNA transfer family protein n=1 Tax=Pseudanabaena sp. SR411 TaxID=1980935 RepID=UPI0020CC78C4|nr:type IV secretory system conjugative DNA transfer family protein [Pseudanabaena sp. SR411]